MFSLNPVPPAVVRQLAAANRVQQHPECHAFQHHVPWDLVIVALRFCYHVAKDKRAEHPAGFVAFGQATPSRKLRVDFEKGQDDHGALILVVTAFDYPGR